MIYTNLQQILIFKLCIANDCVIVETFCLIVSNFLIYKPEVTGNHGSTCLYEHEIGWLNWRCQSCQQTTILLFSLEKRTGIGCGLRLCLSTSLMCCIFTSQGISQLNSLLLWRYENSEKRIKNLWLAKMGCVYAMIF